MRVAKTAQTAMPHLLAGLLPCPPLPWTWTVLARENPGESQKKKVSIIISTAVSAVNKARPVRIGNLTFTWKAPPTDYGPIQFVASIVKGRDTIYSILYPISCPSQTTVTPSSRPGRSLSTGFLSPCVAVAEISPASNSASHHLTAPRMSQPTWWSWAWMRTGMRSPSALGASWKMSR